MNIPLGLAITELIAESSILTIAHHHDFFWERERFLKNAYQDYLRSAFPPNLRSMRHVVINSIASEQLSHRLGVSNVVIPNVYNFAKRPKKSNPKQLHLRTYIGLDETDPFILQPTRIIPRKCIERSIELVKMLKLKKSVLVISHASGDEGDVYYQRIQEYARNLGVQLVNIEHLISEKSQSEKELTGKYSLGDLYQNADIITYPSKFEGFGNAFLETVYYRKPIIINRYPVFIADIEPKGFDVLVLSSFVTSDLIYEIKNLLNNPQRMRKMADKNYTLAHQSFSYEVLEKKLMHLVNTF
jgi:glycosyltransferase involved in cell wall biosynthesis